MIKSPMSSFRSCRHWRRRAPSKQIEQQTLTADLIAFGTEIIGNRPLSRQHGSRRWIVFDGARFGGRRAVRSRQGPLARRRPAAANRTLH
jgi:hypothetical protein